MTYIKLNLDEALTCATALKVLLSSTNHETMKGDADEKLIGKQLSLIIESVLSKLYEIEGVEAEGPVLSNKLIDIIGNRLGV